MDPVTVEVPVMALNKATEKMDDLAVQVAVLTTQHQYTLEALNRLELTLREQSASTGEYRAQLQQQIGDVTAQVRTVETRLQTVVEDLAKIAERGAGAWLRKHAPIIGVTVTVLAALVTLLRWLLLHYR